MASERLAETLRAELRAILDNGGKPFDLQVARHVYDFAIAAKDLLTVSVKSVEDAMRVVADNNGAMESLTGPGEAPPPEVASETFGARIMRELLATLPAMLRKNSEDLHALVGAIADARDRGMPDLAAKLEQRLLGTPLESPKITHAEVVHDSYEHGLFEQGVGPLGSGKRHAVWVHQLRAGGYRWKCSCGAQRSHHELDAALLAEARAHFDQAWEPAAVPIGHPICIWNDRARKAPPPTAEDLALLALLARDLFAPPDELARRRDKGKLPAGVEVVHLCGLCGRTFEIKPDDPHWVTGRGPICPPSPEETR